MIICIILLIYLHSDLPVPFFCGAAGGTFAGISSWNHFLQADFARIEPSVMWIVYI
jgi:hypothetical protein